MTADAAHNNSTLSYFFGPSSSDSEAIMPIKVSCQCGQQFAAKDELAGKVVKCPKCQQPLTIGAPAAAKRAPAPAATPSAVAELLDEVGFHVHKGKEEDTVQHCPACDAKISDHAVLCVYCGFHLESGKFVKGVAGSGPGGLAQKAEGHEGVAQLLLKKAEQTIETDKDEERKIRTQGMPLWMLITILSIIATFAVGMSVLPRDKALLISGYVWFGVCGFMAIVYWFRMVIIAFKEGVLQGLLFHFIFPYSLYYVVTHWSDMRKLFLTYLLLSCLAPLGLILVVVAPKFEEIPVPRRAITRQGTRPCGVCDARSQRVEGTGKCRKSIPIRLSRPRRTGPTASPRVPTGSNTWNPTSTFFGAPIGF